jgi:hypothetical protein
VGGWSVSNSMRARACVFMRACVRAVVIHISSVAMAQYNTKQYLCMYPSFCIYKHTELTHTLNIQAQVLSLYMMTVSLGLDYYVCVSILHLIICNIIVKELPSNMFR